uniref:60S ribosomal protein L26 n=1 Tax=Brugia timori TaxID=42155 RepID=A0A0R3QUG7_9BILA
LNQNVVQHHTVVQNFVVQQSLAEKPKHSPESTSSGSGVTKSTVISRANNKRVISLRDSLIVRSSAKKHIVTVKGIPACIIEYKKREDDKKLLERRASPKQASLKKDLTA